MMLMILVMRVEIGSLNIQERALVCFSSFRKLNRHRRHIAHLPSSDSDPEEVTSNDFSMTIFHLSLFLLRIPLIWICQH